MGWIIGTGIGIPFRMGGGGYGAAYWATRTPSNLVAVDDSNTQITLTWNDAVAAGDGLKVYLSTNGGTTYVYNSTIAFGVETKILTGLTAGTTYTIKLVAYKGINESNPLLATEATYTYRKRIPIAGAAGAGTNYQVMAEVNSGAGADGAGVVYLNSHSLDFPFDVIFTSADGITKIPIWIDNVKSTATKKYFWVRPAVDLSSGTQYVYAYYGKTIGSYLIDGDAVFNFYENFDDYKSTELVENFTTLTELEALCKPNRYRGSPIISHGGGGWRASQVHFPQIVVDPADSTKLIMFLGGMAAPVAAGTMSIGRYTGTVADPYTWVEYGSNPILQKGAGGTWDAGSVIGPDKVLWNPDDSKFYMYYTGRSAVNIDNIGLATSTDGITWTKHASNPILTADGNGRDDGDNVSQCSVIREGANWYMYYCYRNGATILPGIRCASSADGITWTKQGAGDLISVGAWYDTTYIEGSQVLKLGTKYVLLYSCYNGAEWQTAIASSDSYNSGFTKSSINPIFGPSLFEPYGIAGDWDYKHESTFNVFNIANKWYGFYQGADGSASPYGNNTWDLGIATFDFAHHKTAIQGGLNGLRGWTADVGYTITRTLTKDGIQCVLTTTPTATSNATHTISASNTLKSFSVYLRATSTLDYTAHFYAYEGATQITGIGIHLNNLEHLKSAAWETVQAVSIDTWYKVTIAFPTKSTHLIYVNDVLKGALATSNIANITNNIDSIRIQRYGVTAGTSYFDAVVVNEYLASPPVVGTADAEE